MSEIARLEQIVHVVVAKPIAWTLYGCWQAGKWVCRGAVSFGSWAAESVDRVQAEEGSKPLFGGINKAHPSRAYCRSINVQVLQNLRIPLLCC